jgi:glycosyltransferase involved in cell wall biosynthesis
MKQLLSVVIITFNEEKNIAKCIDAIRDIADDIVVVDSFSTDTTAQICKSKEVRFLQHRFDGYGAQKNYANSQARYDIILNLDADEIPSPKLKASIVAALNNWESDAYSCNRLNNYCGKWIRHGAWYPDKKIRLYHRQKGTWTSAIVHETFASHNEASISHLEGDLWHFSYQTREQHLRQAEKYSSLGATEAFQKGKKATLIHRFFNPCWRFIRDYLLRLGCLDGYYGWVIAKTTAYEVYLKYVKLHEMYMKKS